MGPIEARLRQEALARKGRFYTSPGSQYAAQNKTLNKTEIAVEGNAEKQLTIDSPLQGARLIMEAVGVHYGLSITDLTGLCRAQSHATPRHLAMYLMHKRLGQSLAWIGRRFGRDHTTALSGIRRIEAKIASDIEFGSEAMRLLDQIPEAA